MALDGWFPSWFEAAYFPSVWFAPGDESQIPDEELREEYQGHGRRRQGRVRTPTRTPRQDSDADIRRLVEAKWEAIDAANARDAARKAAATKPEAVQLANEPQATASVAPAIQPATMAVETKAMAADAARLAAQAKADAQKRSNDAALMMILAEL